MGKHSVLLWEQAGEGEGAECWRGGLWRAERRQMNVWGALVRGVAGLNGDLVALGRAVCNGWDGGEKKVEMPDPLVRGEEGGSRKANEIFFGWGQ